MPPRQIVQGVLFEETDAVPPPQLQQQGPCVLSRRSHRGRGRLSPLRRLFAGAIRCMEGNEVAPRN